MRISSQEKIQRINDERIIVLKTIEKHIVDGIINTNEDINRASYILKLDDKSVKEYNSLVNAQKLIIELTQEIMAAKNIDDIKKLRNKLNYYINKVKKELKKREIFDNELKSLENNANYLRKGISNYIRFLKREENIIKINELIRNDKENNGELKKLINNELRYNKRKLNLNTNTVIKDISDKKKDDNDKNRQDAFDNWVKEVFNEDESSMNTNTCENDRSSKNDDDWLNTLFDKKENSKKNNDIKLNLDVETIVKTDDDSSNWAKKNLNYDFVNSKNTNNRKIMFSDIPSKQRKSSVDEWAKAVFNGDFISFSDENTNISTTDNSRFTEFEKKYKMSKMHGYSNSFFGNCLSTIMNIPKCIKNKQSINYMLDESKLYYSGTDLLGYIEYSKKRNSILRSFKQLFSKSYLYSRENECLNNHKLCYEWINEYYMNNSDNKKYTLNK